MARVRVVQHVYVGERRDRAWCGRYVGFHQPRPGIVESDFEERRERGLVASVCGHCRRAIAAHERRVRGEGS